MKAQRGGFDAVTMDSWNPLALCMDAAAAREIGFYCENGG